MKIEQFARRCTECGGKGWHENYRLCSTCLGSGNEVVIDEGHSIRAAVSEFLADVRSKYLGVVRAK